MLVVPITIAYHVPASLNVSLAHTAYCIHAETPKEKPTDVPVNDILKGAGDAK